MKNIMPLKLIPIRKRMEVIMTFLEKIKVRKKDRNWRKLRGSAKGEKLLEALLKSRREDLKLEK